MKTVPTCAARRLMVLGCVVLLAGCATTPPPVPSEQPIPSAVPPSQTPTSAPQTSGEPSTTEPSAAPSSTQPSPEPSTSAAPRPLTPPAVPKVTGTAAYGKTLGVSQGAWRPAPVTLAFQWLRDGDTIAGATSATYKLAGTDITHRIAVRVTGSRDGYASASVRSSQVGPVTPAVLTPATPTISGTVKVGHTLTGKTAAWGPGTVSLAWQWYRDSAAISGATATTYKLVVADYHHTVKVRVTGTRTNHTASKRDSKPTAKVGSGTLKPAPDPVLSGTARVGESLSADAGGWGPGTVVLAYQWFRNGGKTDIAIAGATSQRYTATVADVETRLHVRVTGTRKGYATAARYSASSALVAKGELTAPTPVISGPAILGNTLSADAGAWGPGDVAVVVQWYRDGTPIVRANSATHLLTAQDVGHTVTVRVTGSASGYETRTVESAATAKITSR